MRWLRVTTLAAVAVAAAACSSGSPSSVPDDCSAPEHHGDDLDERTERSNLVEGDIAERHQRPGRGSRPSTKLCVAVDDGGNALGPPIRPAARRLDGGRRGRDELAERRGLSDREALRRC